MEKKHIYPFNLIYSLCNAKTKTNLSGFIQGDKLEKSTPVFFIEKLQSRNDCNC